MKLRLLLVPYDSGRRGYRMGAGPEHVLRHGLAAALAAAGHELEVETIEAPADKALPEVGSAFALGRALAPRVRAAVAGGALPVVLAGNCNATLGALAGVGPARTGLVWFDAHGDLNTPETTTSGFFDGMALAVATGRCWAALAASLPGFAPIADDHVVLVGARDLDPGEAAALAGGRLTFVRAAAVRELGAGAALEPALARLAEAVDRVWVHLDLDVLDGDEARVNEFSVAGGITAAELVGAVERIVSALPLAGLTLSAYDPAVDPGNLACRIAIPAITAALEGRRR